MFGARVTEDIPWPAWFPWDQGVFGDLGDKVILQQSSEVLVSHLEAEADLLGGDWGRIFLYGLSQGGMIASWVGLMSIVRFGGVVNHVGCFPLMTLVDVVKHPDIPIIDYHDPLDPVVPWRFVEAGREAALAAGATKYEPIVETTEPKQNHHGLDRGGIAAANEWIKSKLLP
jgi:predicted esterase